jgi:hypothetical protein
MWGHIQQLSATWGASSPQKKEKQALEDDTRVRATSQAQLIKRCYHAFPTSTQFFFFAPYIGADWRGNGNRIFAPLL